MVKNGQGEALSFDLMAGNQATLPLRCVSLLMSLVKLSSLMKVTMAMG